MSRQRKPRSPRRLFLLLSALLSMTGGAIPLDAGEGASPMQVAICPRLVPDLEGGDEEEFVRRVEDLFINKTGQWRYVSENISHFKFYSTSVAWMAKTKPELLRRVVRSITAMDKGIAVEAGTNAS